MKAFVDRIEGGAVVLVIGERQWNLPAEILPAGVAEGDTVEITASRAARRRPGPGGIDWKEK